MKIRAVAGGAGAARIDELVAEGGEVERYSSGPRHVVAPVAGVVGALEEVVPFPYHEGRDSRHHIYDGRIAR